MKTVAAFSLCCALATSSALALNPDAPEISSLSIAPNPVNITAGTQTLTVTLHVTDLGDGLSSGNVSLYNPDGNFVRSGSFASSARISGTALDGTYQVQIPVPQYCIPGTWRVDVTLFDTAGHVQNYGPNAEEFPVPADRYFEVLNSGTVDGTFLPGENKWIGNPPQIGSSEVVPHAVPPGATVTLRLQVTDDVSGFAYGFPYIYDPSNTFQPDFLLFFDDFQRISGDAFDGTYEIPVEIPADAPSGLWHLEYFTVDEAGNAGFQTAGTFIISAGGTGPGALGNAVDAVQYPWTTGEHPWTYQTAVSHDGADAARSGVTPDNGQSIMEADFTGPGTLSFWWRTDSTAGADVLSFDDSQTQNDRSISGDSGWVQETVSFDAGPHHVTWTYAKDASGASGQDCGWVDEVRFISEEADIEPPTLQSLVITPNPVDIATDSQDVTFTITATDDFNGIPAGNLRIIDPFEGEFISLFFDESSRINGDFRGGTFVLTTPIPQGSSPGTWRVELDLYEGNSSTVSSYRPGVLAFPNPGEDVFEVSDGTTVDTHAPQVAFSSIAPPNVDISSGPGTITVNLGITDVGSGFSQGTIGVYIDEDRWTGGTLFTAANRVAGDSHSGVYQVTVPVSAFGPSGTWHIGVTVIDATGNQQEYTPFSLENPLPGGDSFTVVNSGPEDQDTPEIFAIDIAPVAVDITDGAKPITINVTIQEDLSGIRDALLFFYNPGGQIDGSFFQVLDASNRISGNDLTGTYQVTVNIPQGTQNGEWEVRAFLRDRTGRARFYGSGGAPYPQVGDGRFSVSTGTVSPSTYAAFTTLYGLSGNDALAAADPDHDGFNNATELLLGTSPVNGSSNGNGNLVVTRDATHLYLSFTVDATQPVTVNGNYLQLGSGSTPFRVTGQVKNDMGAAWTNVLPVHMGGQTYRVSLPLASGFTGFIRLFFEEG